MITDMIMISLQGNLGACFQQQTISEDEILDSLSHDLQRIENELSEVDSVTIEECFHYLTKKKRKHEVVVSVHRNIAKYKAKTDMSLKKYNQMLLRKIQKVATPYSLKAKIVEI